MFLVRLFFYDSLSRELLPSDVPSTTLINYFMSQKILKLLSVLCRRKNKRTESFMRKKSILNYAESRSIVMMMHFS